MSSPEGGQFESRDARMITEALDPLLERMERALDSGRWPARVPHPPGARSLVLSMLRHASGTYRAIRYLLADANGRATATRDHAAVVAPLNRALVDALCNIIFLFDRFEERVQRYHAAGWAELYLDTQRQEELYGDDPDYARWIKERWVYVASVASGLRVSNEEQAFPRRTAKLWPQSPGDMIGADKGRSKHELRPVNRTYITFLHKRYYKPLSQDAHASWLGLAKYRLIHQTRRSRSAEELDQVELVRTTHVTTAFVAMTAALTEVELALRLELSAELRYLWSILGHWDPYEARPLYDDYYAPHLGPAEITILGG